MMKSQTAAYTCKFTHLKTGKVELYRLTSLNEVRAVALLECTDATDPIKFEIVSKQVACI